MAGIFGCLRRMCPNVLHRVLSRSYRKGWQLHLSYTTLFDICSGKYTPIVRRSCCRWKLSRLLVAVSVIPHVPLLYSNTGLIYALYMRSRVFNDNRFLFTHIFHILLNDARANCFLLNTSCWSPNNDPNFFEFLLFQLTMTSPLYMSKFTFRLVHLQVPLLKYYWGHRLDRVD